MVKKMERSRKGGGGNSQLIRNQLSTRQRKRVALFVCFFHSCDSIDAKPWTQNGARCKLGCWGPRLETRKDQKKNRHTKETITCNIISERDLLRITDIIKRSLLKHDDHHLPGSQACSNEMAVGTLRKGNERISRCSDDVNRDLQYGYSTFPMDGFVSNYCGGTRAPSAEYFSSIYFFLQCGSLLRIQTEESRKKQTKRTVPFFSS